jgi:hypothetical protein
MTTQGLQASFVSSYRRDCRKTFAGKVEVAGAAKMQSSGWQSHLNTHELKSNGNTLCCPSPVRE